eukprot:4402592-Amphidinium_carterae.3
MELNTSDVQRTSSRVEQSLSKAYVSQFGLPPNEHMAARAVATVAWSAYAGAAARQHICTAHGPSTRGSGTCEFTKYRNAGRNSI